MRDFFAWLYECSTQEYLVIKQDIIKPDPLRLAYRDFIKQVINDVITQPESEAIDVIN